MQSLDFLYVSLDIVQASGQVWSLDVVLAIRTLYVSIDLNVVSVYLDIVHVWNLYISLDIRTFLNLDFAKDTI